jgi:hypothetical protein
MRRRAARIDRNHRQIVRALEQVGASVQSLAAVGDGCPDLLVGRAGRWFVLEVKDGSKPPSARTLTPEQREWIDRANGDVHVVTSIDEAIHVVMR